MTLSDVRKFRNKEKEMRIEDLTEYAYTVSERHSITAVKINNI